MARRPTAQWHTISMPDVKLISSDLDGTLFHDDKTISDRTKDILELAAQAGIAFVPATGRSVSGVDKLLQQLPWVRYVITGNGARVYDVSDRTIIHEEMLPVEEVLKIQSVVLHFPVICACYIGDHGVISQNDYDRLDAYIPDKNLLKDVLRLHEPVENFIDTLKNAHQGVLKFQVYFSNPGLRIPITETIRETFPNVSVASTLATNVEITSGGADKGKALKALCGYLQIPIESTVAFGDGVNDMTLLSAAGYGVAVRNAMTEVFSAADAITDSNNNDGVARFIEQYLLR